MANPNQIFKHNWTFRKHMWRNLTTEILIYGRITTTETKAKVVRRYVDRMITKAKKGTLASRRDAEKFLRPMVTSKGVPVGQYLFNDLAKKYKDRNGGYTRIIKAPCRRGDNTKMAVIELV